MNPERKRILILSGIIVAVGILLDQLTKWLCVRFLLPVGRVHLIPHVVDLTYVENTGAAFGMLKDHRWVFMVISVIALVAMTWILTTFKEKKQTLYAVAVSLILSGGIGNMIDRVRLGYVIDFIDISPLFSFAVFNGADSFVCVGAALLVLALLLDWRQEEKCKEAAGTAQGKASNAACGGETVKKANGGKNTGTAAESKATDRKNADNAAKKTADGETADNAEKKAADGETADSAAKKTAADEIAGHVSGRDDTAAKKDPEDRPDGGDTDRR